MAPAAAAAPHPLSLPPLRPGGEPDDPRARDWRPVLEWLESGQGFLLTTHVHSDADGVGSLAALAHALLARGKTVKVVLPGPVPDTCRFLLAGLEAWTCERPEELTLSALSGLDRAVILDVSGLARVGMVADLLRGTRLPLLVLDHHQFCETGDALAVVHPGLSSTGELVGALLSAWGGLPGARAAEALYAALHSDTGGFAYPSTSADTLELAACLVRAGARPARIHAELNQNHPAARFDLLGRVLATRVEHAKGALNEFHLTQAMLRETGATREDADGFVNYGLAIRGARLSLLVCELDDHTVKLNLRCVEPLDVCAVARALGGGGHRLAAGATVTLPFEEARARALQLALAEVGRT